MREIDQLFRLQEINNKISNLSKGKTNLIDTLISKKDDIFRLENDFKMLEIERLGLKKELDKLVLEAQCLDNKLKNEEKKIAIIRNPKEYESLMNNINVVKEKFDDLETKELELMEKIEDNTNLLDNLLEQKTKDFDGLREYSERCKADIENMDSEVIDLKDEKDDLVEKISNSSLANYEKLFNQNGCGVAVVGIEGICGNCSLNIIASKKRTISTGSNQLVKCSNCERYLYWIGPIDE
ncbi:hypothetical protein KAJ27_10885 [bacterium]|nr:hypothetical protein [bacterium]